MVKATNELTVPIKLLGDEESKARLTEIVNKIAKSKLGRETLEKMAESGYTLDFVFFPGCKGICDPEKKTVSLSPFFSDETLFSTLTHEARHAGQFSSGYAPDIKNDNIVTHIMINRAMEADANSTACKTCYELYLQGDEQAYKNFMEEHPLIAEPFEKAVKEGGLENGKAQTAAFNGWYDNNRIKGFYEDTYLQHLTWIAEDGEMGDIKFDKTMTSEEITKVFCYSSDNKNGYYTDNPKNLESGKFIDVSQDTKGFLERFNNARKEMFDLEPDTSLGTIPARQELAVPIKLLGSEEEKARLTGIVNRVAESKFGLETLKIMAENGYSLDLIQMSGIAGICSPSKKTVSLMTGFTDDRLVGILGHEARHAGQFSRGCAPDMDHDNIATQIMLTRAMEADAQSAACKICYELHQQSDKEALKTFNKDNPEIAEPFIKVATKEGIENGKAQTAAFNGWYDNNQTKKVYEDTYYTFRLAWIERSGAMGEVTFKKSMTGEEVAKAACYSSKDKNGYYTDNPKNLEGGKFLDVNEDTMDFLDDFFDKREERYSLEVDPSLRTIPVRYEEEAVEIDVSKLKISGINFEKDMMFNRQKLVNKKKINKATFINYKASKRSR